MFIEVTSRDTGLKMLLKKSTVELVTVVDNITSIYFNPSENGAGVEESYEEIKRLLGVTNGN